MKRLKLPVTDASEVEALEAGDTVLLSGSIYTGRDAAHKRLMALIDQNQPLPIELCGQAIYYVGPCPAKPGDAIGSCGPTTSGRMDSYAPTLIELGLKIMIGKGQRSAAVVDAIGRHGGLYLAACGGAGAYLATCVKAATVVAFGDLGPEAIYKLEVEDFPVTVAIDARKKDLYAQTKGA